MRHHHHSDPRGLILWHTHRDDEERGQIALDKMPLEPRHSHEIDPACHCGIADPAEQTRLELARQRQAEA